MSPLELRLQGPRQVLLVFKTCDTCLQFGIWYVGNRAEVKFLLLATAGRRVLRVGGGGLASAAAFPWTCSNLKVPVLRPHQKPHLLLSVNVLMKRSGVGSDTYEGYVVFHLVWGQ